MIIFFFSLQDYYEVRLKSPYTGRYINANGGGGTYIENHVNVPLEQQTFNLRKLADSGEENKFGLEINGWWFNIMTDSSKYLKLVVKTAGKDQAFEIRTQPYFSERIRFKAADGFFLIFKESNESATPRAMESDENKWANETVFEMTLFKSKQATPLISNLIPATLDNLVPLDGTEVKIKSLLLSKFLCAVSGGGSVVSANHSDTSSEWTTFKLWAIPSTKRYLIQASGKQFMGLDSGLLVALSDLFEPLEIVQKEDDFSRIRLKASNGNFLQVKQDLSIVADSTGSTTWRDEDASVFLLTVLCASCPLPGTKEAIERAAESLREPPPLKLPSFVPSPPTTTPPIKTEILGNYYQARLKSSETHRYLNALGAGGGWVRNQSNVSSDTQTFNLRKVSKNKMVLEINGWYVTLVRSSYDGKYYISASSKTAGKTEVFEIRPQPYQWKNVRIWAPNDNFVRLQKGVADNWVPSADLQKSTIWDDGTAFLLEITRGNTDADRHPRHGSPLDNIKPLDGIKAQFQSAYLKKFLWGRGSLVADEPLNNSIWATFKLWGVPGTDKLVFEASNGQFLGLDQASRLVLAPRPEPFEIVNRDFDFHRIRIKATNGNFLKANDDGSIVADMTNLTSWEADDPSAFFITVTGVDIPNDASIAAIYEATQEPTRPDIKPPPPPPPSPSPELSPLDPLDKVFFDGVRVQFLAVSEKKYVHVQNDGTNAVMANQPKPLRCETFKLRRITETAFQIQAFNEQFVSLAKHGKDNVVANSSRPGSSEMFQIIKVAKGPTRVRIKAPNGSFLQAKSDGSITADFPSSRKWAINDASIFLVSTVTEKQWDEMVSKDQDEDGELEPISSIKAVNLGGWLVADASIKPSLFDGIPNNDLLDGTEVQLKSVVLNKYLSAERGGGSSIIVTASEANDWETFTLWRISERSFQLRACRRQFVGISADKDDGDVVAMSNTPGALETFGLLCDTEDCPDDAMYVRIKAHNGRFLQGNKDGTVKAIHLKSADINHDEREKCPFVFLMTIVNRFRGEFQLVNGYGMKKAEEILKDHWKNFIGEEDFESLAESDLNAVRIPVGWWIARDDNPPVPWPFVSGSLEFLDQAFNWAEEYDLGVIVSLSATPGSQNGLEQSGSRDKFLEWGMTNENIDQTVDVIEFLAARYSERENLVAIELLDKPMAPEVTLQNLMKYYKKGYDAVRRHTSRAYVIMSNRLYTDSTELLDFASRLKGSVVNIHYYNFFSGTDSKELAAELKALTKPNGPSIFIGEWTAKWQERGKWRRTGKEDYRKSAKEKVEALELATFGWGFWTLKSDQKNGVWSQWQTWAKILRETSLP